MRAAMGSQLCASYVVHSPIEIAYSALVAKGNSGDKLFMKS